MHTVIERLKEDGIKKQRGTRESGEKLSGKKASY